VILAGINVIGVIGSERLRVENCYPAHRAWLRQWRWSEAGEKKGRTTGPALHTVALENQCLNLFPAYTQSANRHVTNTGDSRGRDYQLHKPTTKPHE
jgi:hypothetical protein